MGNTLAGITVLMVGGSRGIGLAILKAAARQGANAVFLAKTDQPDPRLPGTVHTARAEIEAAGGRAVAVVGDVRNEEDVRHAVERAVTTFGGIDISINNASALNRAGTETLSKKRFDLLQQVNSRGTFLLTRACRPHLRESGRGQILTLAPPLDLAPKRLGLHPACTLSKYGMTLLTLGFAHGNHGELPVATDPDHYRGRVQPGSASRAKARSPQIVAAAIAVLNGPRRTGCVWSTTRC